ncbi:MAG TPA: amino acid ABC transporter permease [Acidimicrobiales bacterium]|jgi:glutamate transport system permease protein|nr:amino acid ABC transporter permease [Acidimicrobiales bacterium]
MTDLVLGEDLGPRGRRRVAVATTVSVAALVAAVAWAIDRFRDKGQLDADQWRSIFTWSTARFIGAGLRNTLTAALVAMALALLLGTFGAFGRLHPRRPVRAVSIVLIELFRATPLVLLIYFAGTAVPRYLFELSSYWYLVTALALYNGSVIAEVFRAGVLSLGAGQREAAFAIGLSHGQAMRLVLFPQAVRRMVPAVVNQLVTLLKDSSLGALVLTPAFDDLLRRGRQVGEFNRNPLQALLVTGVVYMVINFALSSFARWLETRPARVQRARAQVELELARPTIEPI